MRSRLRCALSQRYLQLRRAPAPRALSADRRSYRRRAARRRACMNEAAWQIPGYLEGRDGRLFMDGVDLVGLVESRRTPLYVYSAKRIAATALSMRVSFANYHPKAYICFASK